METAFFWLSKLAWYAIAPESIVLVLLVASWVLLLRGAIKWAKRVLGLVSIGMLVLAFVPIGEWMLYPLEMRFAANPVLPQRVDGIIVLGGAEDPERSAAWTARPRPGIAPRNRLPRLDPRRRSVQGLPPRPAR